MRSEKTKIQNPDSEIEDLTDSEIEELTEILRTAEIKQWKREYNIWNWILIISSGLLAGASIGLTAWSSLDLIFKIIIPIVVIAFTFSVCWIVSDNLFATLIGIPKKYNGELDHLIRQSNKRSSAQNKLIYDIQKQLHELKQEIRELKKIN